MALEIRTNINEVYGKYTDEYLGKFSPDVREDLIRKEKERQQEYNNFLKNSPDANSITKEELQERQEKQLARVKQLFPNKGIKLPKNSETKGTIVAEHGNKLGFIFIGDTKSSSTDPTIDISAPKISMVVGGGLETTYNPKTGEINSIDPSENVLVGVSSQLHLISAADIDVSGILPISTLKKRSTVRTEADALELYSNEIVLIRSFGRPYKTSGARTMTPGGVHIISGMNSGESVITPPEPMVLGKSLTDVLSEIIIKISDINSILINMNEDMIALKSSLISHTHLGTAGAIPVITTPSVDLGIAVAPTIATKTVLNVANGYSNTLNLELLKTNTLTPLSSKNFLSQYNRVN